MLLLTAFEPFDGTGVNSSLRVLEEYLARHAGGRPVASAVLPVRYDDDTAAVLSGIRRVRPRAVLHLGQCPGARPAAELVAVNLRVRERGGEPEPILPQGPAAYFSTMPMTALAAAMDAVGCATDLSAHAGTYLCNHVLYQSLHRAATAGPAVPAGFLHLPRLPEQQEILRHPIPCLPLSLMVRGLAAAVDRVLADLR
jgi:pyroglutamyl-peptidase